MYQEEKENFGVVMDHSRSSLEHPNSVVSVPGPTNPSVL